MTPCAAEQLPAASSAPPKSRVVQLLRHRAMSDVIIRNLGEQMEAMKLRGMSVQPLYYSQTKSRKTRAAKEETLPTTPQFSWEITPGSPLYEDILTELSHRRRRESALVRTVDRALQLLDREELDCIRALYLTAPLTRPTTMEEAAEDMNLSLKAFRRLHDNALDKLELVLI